MTIVSLSKDEISLLGNLLSDNRDLGLQILPRFVPHKKNYSADLSCDLIERVRDCLTENLAKSGFLGNYEPTPIGDRIEELIDRFHVNC